MKRLRKYWMFLRIILHGGYKRAEFLKKVGYFKSIGEHCYLQPWNFGTEPFMINFGNNVFIGSNSTVLYDVNIGDNVIIGAGSLVNKNIPSGSVAAGVPCKVIGKFDDYKEKIVSGHYLKK